jgi:hypothetical protein
MRTIEDYPLQRSAADRTIPAIQFRFSQRPGRSQPTLTAFCEVEDTEMLYPLTTQVLTEYIDLLRQAQAASLELDRARREGDDS